MPHLLEICIDSLPSARAAQLGGADRIELCAALDLGGLSPGAGLLHQYLDICPLPVMVMLRPRPGDFCYDDDEFAAILHEARLARQLGVQGVVCGILLPDGRIDRLRVQRLLDAVRPLELTFHRAFDLCRDPHEGLDLLLDLGVDRLLTSGQAPDAATGAPLIADLHRRAGAALHIMAGAGVSAANIAAIARQTGVQELHGSARRAALATAAHTGVSMGSADGQPYRQTDAAQVRAMKAALAALG
ncbi:MAG: copper homeostasis protein CutC [Bacteroidia bacterium]